MLMRAHLAIPGLVLLAACASQATTARSPDVFDLVVAGTTDVHGRLRGWNYETNRPDTLRGLSRAATIVDSLRRVAPGRVVLLDAGDLLQGNSLTYVAARVAPPATVHPVIAAMNAMQYDAAAIGNHEFNYGLPFLEHTLTQAKFPFLAVNAYRARSDRRDVHAFLSWTMIERGSVHIGIVGATTPGSMIWDHDNLAGKVVIRDIVPDVRAAVADVRNAGADIVLVTMHSGLAERSSYDTVATTVASENVAARVAREIPGIDLILFGHSHQELGDTVINGTLLMQPKNWSTSVAVAHLALTRTGGRWRAVAKESRVVQAVGHAERRAVLAATDASHDATVKWVTAPIGRTPVAWRADSSRVADTPLMDFILEVERRTTGADLASTAAFSLDASLAPGDVTPARLQALYPYDNTLRAIRISGQQLREYLEQSARYYRTAPDGTVSVDPTIPGFNFDVVSGADYTLDLSRPAGRRVTRLAVRGKPVTNVDSFTMALNNYRQTGGGGFTMLRDAPVVYDKGEAIRQLLLDEVRRKGTLAPNDYFIRNWRLEPAGAVSTLYAQMRRENREDAHATGIAAPMPASTPPRTATRLRIIGTNDFHGALEPRPDNAGRRRGGAAYLASGIRRAAAECVAPACEWVLLDGGDEFQGTPASNLAFGRPVVAIFNALGLSAGALGNHELDWGQDTLRARMREAHYAILGANVRDSDGRDVAWIRDDTLIVKGALRIGVIGVSTVTTPLTTRASNVAGLRFVEPAPIVDSLAKTLRARGADYVVVIAHAGAFCDRRGATPCTGEIIDLAWALKEPVDAIVSGHTHSLVDATVNGIPIVQARSNGMAFDVVDLGPTERAHHVRDVIPDSLPADPVIGALVDEALARVAALVHRPVATIATDLIREGNQPALGNLLADAMRTMGKGDIAVVNHGGIRANLRAGPASYGALFEVQPFSNVLYRLTVGGRVLREYLEKLVAKRLNVSVSGIVVHYDSMRVTPRILSARFTDGRTLRDDANYTIVLNDFLATGGDGLGLSTGAQRTDILSLTDLDAVVEYLRAQPQPVRVSAAPRLIGESGTP